MWLHQPRPPGVVMIISVFLDWQIMVFDGVSERAIYIYILGGWHKYV